MQPKAPLVRAAGTALALALAAAACSDDPTAARPDALSALTQASLSGSAPRSIPFVSNAVKYRDTGKRAARGRAGSAQITALALLGKDGVTELGVTAASADTSRPGTPQIRKVQLKALDHDSAQVGTRNFNGLPGAAFFGTTLGGLARGSRLEVQANVEGIDANRTDVVTATETVKLRPDLAVDVSTLRRASTGVRIGILGVVAERNGDVGARANCLLYVDGTLADQAIGIWVDAGDAVTCAFSHTFNTPGVHTVEVRADSVHPGDYDRSNNADTATIDVVARPQSFVYDAMAQEAFDSLHSVNTQAWRDSTGSFGESTFLFSQTGRSQTAMISGRSPVAMTGPFRVDVFQRGDSVIHAAQYFGVPHDTVPGDTVPNDTIPNDTIPSDTIPSDTIPGDTTRFATAAWSADPYCMAQFDGGVFFFACTSRNESYTEFRYTRSAGSVTYHSYQHVREFDATTGVENVYTSNTSGSFGHGVLGQMGNRYTFYVRFTDGVSNLLANTTFDLVPRLEDYSSPETCWESEGWGNWTRSCSQTTFLRYIREGRDP
ncbi:MAG TPA: hypothetical protein VHG91_01455 [Longimicrobium sp.]|nr:hypothetical protein [Longimicrobium sp.]